MLEPLTSNNDWFHKIGVWGLPQFFNRLTNTKWVLLLVLWTSPPISRRADALEVNANIAREDIFLLTSSKYKKQCKA